jgi:hypothetical protein
VATVGTSGRERAGIAPRVANAALGAWLVLSVLAWPHLGPEGFNTLVTGLLVLTVAPIAVWAPRMRFGTLFLGVWLFLTTFLFVHQRTFTFWHDLVASLVLLALAAVPSRPWRYREERARA